MIARPLNGVLDSIKEGATDFIKGGWDACRGRNQAVSVQQPPIVLTPPVQQKEGLLDSTEGKLIAAAVLWQVAKK
jgi:hypothetical protein